MKSKPAQSKQKSTQMKWTREETERFYMAVQVFSNEHTTLAGVLGRTPKQIKVS